MKLNRPFSRFLLGFVCLLIVLAVGFTWVGYSIPTWNATKEEVEMALPGDELVAQAQLIWNHGITIQASADEIYPWLVQMGDTRGAYYSYTFIENLFMLAGKMDGRYVNADRIHPEWQDPPIGEGVIVDMFEIKGYQPGEYVLAGGSPKLEEIGFYWTWLWYLQSVDQDTTRLIVRHRFDFPEEMPEGAIKLVLNAGYVMERGMMLGIQSRAEERAQQVPAELVEVFLWLIALACGVISAIYFIRKPGRLHPLGIGLEAVIVLFIFTFVQPALWVRVVLDGILIFSVLITLYPARMVRWIKSI